MLESSALEVYKLSRKMHRLEKSIKAKYGVEPRGLARRQRGRKRWEIMWKKRRDKLKELGKHSLNSRPRLTLENIDN